jgi:competence protein ComEA
VTVADWRDRLRWPLSLAVLAAGLAAGVLLLRQEPAPPLVISSPTPGARELRAYVSGAVVNPGVYTFTEGARIEDALRAAGGPTSEADLDRLNLAIRLRDELHVQVPYKPLLVVPVAGGESTLAAGVLNLNTASAADLESLPGVGPVTAKRILDHRQSNGPFNKIEELLELKIVGASTFEKIRGRITAP